MIESMFRDGDWAPGYMVTDVRQKRRTSAEYICVCQEKSSFISQSRMTLVDFCWENNEGDFELSFLVSQWQSQMPVLGFLSNLYLPCFKYSTCRHWVEEIKKKNLHDLQFPARIIILVLLQQ